MSSPNTKRSRIYYCAASGCQVNSRTHPLERLFRFPRSSLNLERYLKWVEFAKNPRLRTNKPVEAYMCARHFTRNQFRTDYQMTLVYQAVPSIPSEHCSSYSDKHQLKAPLEKSHEEVFSCESPLQYLQKDVISSNRREVNYNYKVDKCSLTSEYHSQTTDKGEEGKEEQHSTDVCNWYLLPPHVRDHCYSTNGNQSLTPIIDADHNYHSNSAIELPSETSLVPTSPPALSDVLMTDLIPEEHPWFKITHPSQNNDGETIEDNHSIGSVQEDKDSVENNEKVDDVKAIQSYIGSRRRLDSTKIQMSITRYKAFIQREKHLSTTLKMKDQTLKRLTQRYREKIVKVKELARSNKELTKLVEALSNSVSVCCDLLGIHDVVFKT